VAISGNGLTIAASDPTDIGTINIYTQSSADDPSWNLTDLVTLTPDSTPGSNFGRSIRLSEDGHTLIAGGPGADGGVGSAMVWKLVDGEWVTPPDTVKPVGYSVGDTGQGHASSISKQGTVFVTGGPLDNNQAGAVWVYRRDRFMWVQDGGKIAPTDSTAGSMFGHSVAMSHDGTTFAVGAPRDSGGNGLPDHGAVWVYRYNLETHGWVQQGSKIRGGTIFESNHYQGSSVSLSGDGNTLAIGAPKSTVPNPTPNPGVDGDVFIFVYSDDAWVQQGEVIKLTGLSESTSGWAVSLSEDGDTLVIGAPSDNAAAVFTRSGGGWAQYGALLTNIGIPNDINYGAAVSISADASTIAVGAPGLPGNQGYVDVWVNVDGIWILQTNITETQFGGSVDLTSDGNVLCVGALYDTNNKTPMTYTYTRDIAGAWSQFDDPIVGEPRISGNYQGFSSSVGYVGDTTAGFILIIGGIGYNAYQGGNQSYISHGIFSTVESYTVPTRAYTISDLINVINSGLAMVINLEFKYVFNLDTRTVMVTVEPVDTVSASFKLNTENTFDIFEFRDKDVHGEILASVDVDFSINNNIIKSINTSNTVNNIIYDTTPNTVFRKYEAGYSITSDGVIDIQLRDERDRIVDLYGADWVMTVYATIHN
jgi:hypothetical protein